MADRCKTHRAKCCKTCPEPTPTGLTPETLAERRALLERGGYLSRAETLALLDALAAWHALSGHTDPVKVMALVQEIGRQRDDHMVRAVRFERGRDEAQRALADLREKVAALLAASENDGRGGTFVHDTYLRALLDVPATTKPETCPLGKASCDPMVNGCDGECETDPAVPDKCTGADNCPTTLHVHGCYADMGDGDCDDPDDHKPAVPVPSEADRPDPGVVDLLAALQQSVNAAKAARTDTSTPATAEEPPC